MSVRSERILVKTFFSKLLKMCLVRIVSVIQHLIKSVVCSVKKRRYRYMKYIYMGVPINMGIH